MMSESEMITRQGRGLDCYFFGEVSLQVGRECLFQDDGWQSTASKKKRKSWKPTDLCWELHICKPNFVNCLEQKTFLKNIPLYFIYLKKSEDFDILALLRPD